MGEMCHETAQECWIKIRVNTVCYSWIQRPLEWQQISLDESQHLRVGNILQYLHTILGTLLAHNPVNATWEAIARQRLTLDMLIAMTEEKRIQPACHFSE